MPAPLTKASPLAVVFLRARWRGELAGCEHRADYTFNILYFSYTLSGNPNNDRNILQTVDRSRRSEQEDTLSISDASLTLEEVAGIVSRKIRRVTLGPSARRAIETAHRFLRRLIEADSTIYGVNTGVGKLAHKNVAPNALVELQYNLVRSHAVGVGPELDVSETCVAMILLIASLSKGFSGVSLSLVEHLCAMFNQGVIPIIPEKGSVGASGDLAPLAHLALVVIGEGRARILSHGEGASRPLSGRTALRRAKLSPHRLGPKEGLSLLNGTYISTAILATAVVRARDLARVADIAGAMTVASLHTPRNAFDSRVTRVRPHPGAVKCAANLRQLLCQGQDVLPESNMASVPPAYSTRCIPQVHGAMRDALDFVTAVVERELNSVTDNPLVFSDTKDVIVAGNFHGQPIALVADVLSVAMTDVSSIIERRIETLVNPDCSGLPGFLTPREGLNSGLMLVQVMAASLVSENKASAFPASIDSIPTSANREDHVSMSTLAARKARAIVSNTTLVLAAELLCAAQAVEFHRPRQLPPGLEATYQLIRQHVAPLENDRTLYQDVESIAEFIEDGRLLRAVQCDAGHLE